jgi:hypothetical protein
VRGRQRSQRSRRTSVLTIAAATLPLLALLLVSLGRLGATYSPDGDNALIEMHVRDILHHPVLVGAYSRSGWFHPGPALYYLLWLPYQIAWHASSSLIPAAVLINLLSVAGIIAIIHRRAGRAAAWWAAIVLLLDLRLLGATDLQNVWNPTVSILPFALFLVTAWSVLCDDLWLLPVAAGLGSFVVQCHVGFLLPVAAVGLVLAARTVIRLRHDRSWSRPLIVTLAVIAILWAPPVIDELTGHPGNLTAILRYARAPRPTWGWQEAANTVVTQIGRLPAWIVGRKPIFALYASPKLPLWPGLLGVGALVAIAVVAARRRQTEALWLLLVVVIAGFAAAAFVKRIDGPDWSYLGDWISSIGVVLWIAVGVCLLAPRRSPVGSSRPSAGSAGSASSAVRPFTAVTVGLGVVAAALAIGGTWNVLAAPRLGSNTSPAITQLSASGRQWARANHVNAVKLDFGPDPDLALSVLGTGTGVALQLERHGINTKVAAIWRLQFGPSRTVHGTWRGPVLVVGTSYRPPPGSERLAMSGPFVLYVLRA